MFKLYALLKVSSSFNRDSEPEPVLPKASVEKGVEENRIPKDISVEVRKELEKKNLGTLSRKVRFDDVPIIIDLDLTDGEPVKSCSGRTTLSSTNPDWRGNLPSKLCHYPGEYRKALSHITWKTMAVFNKGSSGLRSQGIHRREATSENSLEGRKILRGDQRLGWLHFWLVGSGRI